MTGIDVASPDNSSAARSVASSSSTLFASSTHASVEVKSPLSSSYLSWIGSIIFLVVRCILDRLDRFSCRYFRDPLCHVDRLTACFR